MSQTAVSDRLVQLLHAAGVEVVFGIGGTHSLSFIGAFERDPRVRFVSARNEQGAGYMASAYARLTGRPGVIVTSTGPGALNSLSGLADARWSSLPILHLTTFADLGTFSGGIHESPAQSEVMSLVGHTSHRVVDGDVDGPFWEAWCACTERPGRVATLEVHSKVWNTPATESPRAAGPAPATPPVSIESIVESLDDDVSVAIYVGGGVLRDDATQSMRALAEALDAPIVTSFQGKAVATWDHPLYIGPWATEEAVRELVASADVCLVFGSKLSALATGHWGLRLPAVTYWVDPAADRHGQYPDLVPIQGRSAGIAGRLLDAVAPRERGMAHRVAAIRRRVHDAVSARAPVEVAFVRSFGEGLSGTELLSFDMNKASFWFMKYLPALADAPHSFSSYLCMGSALPYAIGLAEARPGHGVMALMGDGGFQMGITELATIAERRLPIAVTVFVDGAYGLLRDNGAIPGVRGSERLGVDLVNPDFGQLAAAFEMEYTVVEHGDELAQIARKVSAPTLVEVPLDFSRSW